MNPQFICCAAGAAQGTRRGECWRDEPRALAQHTTIQDQVAIGGTRPRTDYHKTPTTLPPTLYENAVSIQWDPRKNCRFVKRTAKINSSPHLTGDTGVLATDPVGHALPLFVYSS